MIALLSALSDGKKHFYTDLCQELSVTKQQLAEDLQQLDQQGIEICCEADGCYWLAAAELLDRAFLTKNLPHQQLLIQPVIDSTNQYLLNNLPKLSNNSVCLAEYQFAGRGRRGRQWLSPFAGQVIMSYYRIFSTNCDISGLSLAVGMAVAQALTELNLHSVQLKWPNDIWLNGKKLGGILIEMKHNPHLAQNQVVIGLGLNVNLPKKIVVDQPITMVSEQQNINRNLLIVKLIQHLAQALTLFEQQGLSAFISQWRQYDAFYQKKVKLLLENQSIIGIEQGINAKGELLLNTEDNQQLSFSIGEISLRPISDQS